MIKNLLFRLTCLSLLLTSATFAQQPAPAPAAAPVASVGPHENLNAILWVQHSAEYRASLYQIFQNARRNLQDALADKNWTAALEQDGEFQNLPPAIVLDLDETVLDNSAFQTQLLLQNQTWSEHSWQQWVERERALPLPGAAEFLNYVHSKGVVPFYVTNRVCDGANASDHTLALLRTLQYPVKPAQLLCRTSATDSNDKSPRRAKVAATHRILLLLGDDLNDFITIPRMDNDVDARLNYRANVIDTHRNDWGVRWIIIPNPTYGSWERALGANVDEKRRALRSEK